ncbi:hypothetical protein [uncultured Tenacibaculum sp.]|uniref:hypothetical protein n=1 Tax=uncultured Tenacibaculum sp. TaxID=174713 RepID=UPI00263989A8|nr:hypothetical protein [uncultured Tenacibaculum sp.]
MEKEEMISFFREDYSGNKLYKSFIKVKDSTYDIYLKFNSNKYDLQTLKNVKIYYNSNPFLGFSDDTLGVVYRAFKRYLNEEYRDIKDTIYSKSSLVFQNVSSKKIDTIFSFNHGNKEILLQKNRPLVIRKKNYQQEIEDTKDSILNNQMIDDLIRLDNPNVYWRKSGKNTIKFHLSGGDVVKLDKFDLKVIKSIRFKVFIKDEFDETLHETVPITFELPIKIDKSTQFGTAYEGNEAKFKLTYNKNDFRYKSLEKSRLYRKNNNIKVESKILAIAFDDGTVLKK